MCGLLLDSTENLFHSLHQCDDTFITDSVVDKICFPAKFDDTLIAQDVKMLGYVGPGRCHGIPDFTDGQLFILEQTEDLQPDRVRHGFEHPGKIFNLVFNVLMGHSSPR
jgi:hypothetical protein